MTDAGGGGAGYLDCLPAIAARWRERVTGRVAAGEEAAPGGLDTRGVKVPDGPAAPSTGGDDGVRRRWRRARWRARERLRAVAESAGLRSVARCACRPVEGDQARIVSDRRGRANWSGLARCKSGWACPVCACVRAAERAATLTGLVEAAREAGAMRWRMVTLTHPHGPHDTLADMLAAVLGSWSAMWRSTTRREAWRAAGGLGAIRAVEATHGVAGWHVHLHVAVCEEEWGAAAEWLVEAWLSGDSTRHRVAQHIRDDDADLAEYVGKGALRWGLGSEVGAGAFKGSRHGLQPLEIAEAALRGDVGARDLWREWCAETKGRRAWHVVDRARLEKALGRPVNDDDADEEPPTVAAFTLAQWASIRRAHAALDVLRAEESRPGLAAMLAALPAEGLYTLLLGDDWSSAVEIDRQCDAPPLDTGPPAG